MRTRIVCLAAVSLLLGPAVPPASAQKGTGDATGVARQAVRPEVVSLSGKVVEIEIGPCENTTGQAVIGTHFILESPKGEKLNVHLGPAQVVDFVADQLPLGKQVKVQAFRTERMSDRHYVAQSLAVDGKTIRLRDDSLAPVWSGGNPRWAGRGGPQPAAGYGRGLGPGYGRGPIGAPALGYGRELGQGRAAGYGRGAGRGRGAGYGRGAGWGRGAGYGHGSGWAPAAGYGRGLGQAAGRGLGRGPGWAFLDEDRDGVCDRYERAWAQP